MPKLKTVLPSEVTLENIADMRADDMRSALRARGLDTSGRKADMSERLTQAIKDGVAIMDSVAKVERRSTRRRSSSPTPAKRVRESRSSTPVKTKPRRGRSTPAPKKNRASSPLKEVSPSIPKTKPYSPKVSAVSKPGSPPTNRSPTRTKVKTPSPGKMKLLPDVDLKTTTPLKVTTPSLAEVKISSPGHQDIGSPTRSPIFSAPAQLPNDTLGVSVSSHSPKSDSPVQISPARSPAMPQRVPLRYSPAKLTNVSPRTSPPTKDIAPFVSSPMKKVTSPFTTSASSPFPKINPPVKATSAMDTPHVNAKQQPGSPNQTRCIGTNSTPATFGAAFGTSPKTSHESPKPKHIVVSSPDPRTITPTSNSPAFGRFSSPKTTTLTDSSSSVIRSSVDKGLPPKPIFSVPFVATSPPRPSSLPGFQASTTKPGIESSIVNASSILDSPKSYSPARSSSPSKVAASPVFKPSPPRSISHLYTSTSPIRSTSPTKLSTTSMFAGGSGVTDKVSPAVKIAVPAQPIRSQLSSSPVLKPPSPVKPVSPGKGWTSNPVVSKQFSLHSDQSQYAEPDVSFARPASRFSPEIPAIRGGNTSTPVRGSDTRSLSPVGFKRKHNGMYFSLHLLTSL